ALDRRSLSNRFEVGNGRGAYRHPPAGARVLPPSPPAGYLGGMTRLRRSDPHGPGLRRMRRGRGFEYRTSDGVRIEDAAVLERLRALAVPPAWTDVWLCP